MLQFQVEIKGSKETRQRLKRIGTGLFDLRHSMNQIGSEAGRYYANQGFNSQGGVFGASWSPLARTTILRKSKKYPGRPPMVATGKMRNSFTYSASSRQVLIGNKVDYFKYHQSTAPRRRLPRRAMMGVNDPIKRMVRDVITKEIHGKIRSA